MYIYEKSVLIKCRLEEIFDFHCDTNNLLLISPSYIKVKIIEIDKPVRLNSEIKLEVTQFNFLKTYWHIKISNYEKNYVISDLQIKGPFKFWEHYHIFEQINDNVKMTDRLSYKLPFGFLGKIINKLFLKNLINKQFEYRHIKTKEIFEK